METLRNRAIQAILKNINKASDNEVDDIARKLLKLPFRPLNSKPFVGWLMPIEQTVNTSSSSQKVTSQKGIDLIKKWEGFRHEVYLCPAGVPTIGYGHTKNANGYGYITKAQGEGILKEDLKVYESAVNRLVKVPINQNQFDALVSFTYNLGEGAFAKSSLLKEVNNSNHELAATWFAAYVYAGKKKLKGLVDRRADESELYLS